MTSRHQRHLHDPCVTFCATPAGLPGLVLVAAEAASWRVSANTNGEIQTAWRWTPSEKRKITQITFDESPHSNKPRTKTDIRRKGKRYWWVKNGLTTLVLGCVCKEDEGNANTLVKNKRLTCGYRILYVGRGGLTTNGGSEYIDGMSLWQRAIQNAIGNGKHMDKRSTRNRCWF